MKHYPLAPELEVSDWLNTAKPLTLKELQGQIVVIEAFQMLCPGCVAHGLPLVQRVAAVFENEPVTVLGLHTVFEHHAAQGTRTALEAFLHEYRIDFPVAIDQPSTGSSIPKTMQSYQLQGTPSIILIDRQGRLRQRAFGNYPELRLGADIQQLLDERDIQIEQSPASDTAPVCDEHGCVV